MRIGFDAKRAFANKTGLGNYSRFILNALRSYEPEQEYFAYTSKNNQSLFPEFPDRLIRRPTGFLNRKIPAYWRYAGIARQLKHEKIEVFHGLSNEIPQGLSKAGIRSVVTIHDLIFEKLPHLFKPADRLIYRHKFRSACERADAIIAISEQTKNDLIALYNADKGKIHVIYQDSHPIFEQSFAVEDDLKIVAQYGLCQPYILSVGTLEERKNQHRLVEAFAAIQEKDISLVLVGKPTPYVQKIRETIARHKLENRVVLLHDVPHLHLPALFRQAQVFAYISVYEGFGIPIVEAIHSGVPVVAATGSCLEEAGGNGALYANPQEQEDITAKLSQIIFDKPLRNEIVKKGSEYVKRFDGRVIAGELVDLYRTL